MTKNRLDILIKNAKQDLYTWFSYANVTSLKEFEQEQENIKSSSYHKYTDIVKHLQYIKKLENLYAKL